MGLNEDAVNSSVHLTGTNELHPYFVIVLGLLVVKPNPKKIWCPKLNHGTFTILIIIKLFLINVDFSQNQLLAMPKALEICVSDVIIDYLP
jgi:hypothetical protein